MCHSQTPLALLQSQTVDQTITETAEALDLVQSRIHAVVSEDRSHRNTVAPINSLPVEIFSQILLLSFEMEDWSMKLLQNRASVCRQWFSVVMSTTALWQFAKCHVPSGSQPVQDALALTLRKSKDAPIAVSIDWRDNSYNGQEGSETKGQMEEIQQVKEQAHRWKYLAFTGVVTPLVLRALDAPFPQLHKLVMKNQEPGSGRFTPVGTIRGSPNLQHISLQWIGLRWDTLLITGLRSLVLKHLRGRVGHHIPTMEQLFSILESSPNLQELVLCNIRTLEQEQSNLSTEEVSTHSILLPRLRSLVILWIPRSITYHLFLRVRTTSIVRLRLNLHPPHADLAPQRLTTSPFRVQIVRTLHVVCERQDAWLSTYDGDRKTLWSDKARWDSPGYRVYVSQSEVDYGLELVAAAVRFRSSDIRVFLHLMDDQPISYHQKALDLMKSVEVLDICSLSETGCAHILEVLAEFRDADGRLGWRCSRLKELKLPDGIAVDTILDFFQTRFAPLPYSQSSTSSGGTAQTVDCSPNLSEFFLTIYTAALDARLLPAMFEMFGRQHVVIEDEPERSWIHVKLTYDGWRNV